MSELKVNKISPKTACGTTTLGDSGDSFTIPAGVTITNNGTQTGFGRAGSVDWQTGSIKTTAFSAESGKGYFVDTATTGAVTATLPSSPSAGDIVAFKDYALNWDTANLTIGRGGSKINGYDSADVTVAVKGGMVILVYVNSTKGWIPTQDDSSTLKGISPSYIAASGGTESTCGDYKIHTFTGPGTFTVTNLGNVAGSSTVSYVVVAGGGAGGTGPNGAGGGAGGYREGKAASDCFTASPLATTGLAVTAGPTAYPITIGAGGSAGSGGPEAYNSSGGNSGNNTTFSTITSAGGGRGAGQPGNSSNGPGEAGGSGGGNNPSFPNAAYAGNTPPVSPPQGNPGGNAHPGSPTPSEVGGGGGAIATSQPTGVYTGGCGATSSITGSPVTRAGGGGGGSGTHGGLPSPSGRAPQGGGLGGPGGGGNGNKSTSPGTPSSPGVAGTVNTGGGGGGGGRQGSVVNYAGGAGGSGVVIIRYKYQ